MLIAITLNRLFYYYEIFLTGLIVFIIIDESQRYIFWFNYCTLNKYKFSNLNNLEDIDNYHHYFIQKMCVVLKP